MSSHYADTFQLLKWLDSATFSPITKNKVRKELLEELHSICKIFITDDFDFKDPSNIPFVIPQAHLSSIRSLLQRDGKGDSLTNDELLNFNTTIDTLMKSVKKHYNTVVKFSNYNSSHSSMPIAFSHGAPQLELGIIDQVKQLASTTASPVHSPGKTRSVETENKVNQPAFYPDNEQQG